MSIVNGVEGIKAWPKNDEGWYVAPNGNRVQLADEVTLGYWVQLGNYVRLGNRVQLGNDVRLGDWVRLGNCVRLGNDVRLGDWVRLGYGVRLGDRVRLGDEVQLGNGVRLGDGVSSAQIIQDRIDALIRAGRPLLAWKWVTPQRKSPNFDGGSSIEYPKDAVIEAEGDVSDQQCAPGLHVLPVGVRPEHAGLCSAEHYFIPLLVEYQPEDILFPGLPGNSDKIRVRKLRVLE